MRKWHDTAQALAYMHPAENALGHGVAKEILAFLILCLAVRATAAAAASAA